MSDPESHLRLKLSECRLVVVQDHLQSCPYLDGTTARMPLRLPVGQVTPETTDEILALGYRRSGDFVYRTQCPSCTECKPTRVLVDQFQLTKSMKRVLSRGNRDLICSWQAPEVSSRRVELFNQHRSGRNLGSSSPVDAESYRSFLVDTCCETLELTIHRGDELVGISIVDLGRTSMSAVYTHFDPTASWYSLGTYAILKQLEFAKQTSRSMVYLGMYVSVNRHLNYKARFGPQERLIDGKWTLIDSPHGTPMPQASPSGP